jgi:NhaP-type Na+/H+ or K+/H+ antiporter
LTQASYGDEGISVILEGETMINNAITIAMHQVIRTWIIKEHFPTFWHITLYWAWPFVFGFVWGKIVARFLARTPPDVVIEILTTVVATYALFYIVDEFVGTRHETFTKLFLSNKVRLILGQNNASFGQF